MNYLRLKVRKLTYEEILSTTFNNLLAVSRIDLQCAETLGIDVNDSVCKIKQLAEKQAKIWYDNQGE